VNQSLFERFHLALLLQHGRLTIYVTHILCVLN